MNTINPKERLVLATTIMAGMMACPDSSGRITESLEIVDKLIELTGCTMENAATDSPNDTNGH